MREWMGLNSRERLLLYRRVFFVDVLRHVTLCEKALRNVLFTLCKREHIEQVIRMIICLLGLVLTIWTGLQFSWA